MRKVFEKERFLYDAADNSLIDCPERKYGSFGCTTKCAWYSEDFNTVGGGNETIAMCRDHIMGVLPRKEV